jgi:hypothetical protein
MYLSCVVRLTCIVLFNEISFHEIKLSHNKLRGRPSSRANRADRALSELPSGHDLPGPGKLTLVAPHWILQVMTTQWSVGAARRDITPRHSVELAGCGYYLHRYGTEVRDRLAATAVVIGCARGGHVAMVGLDMMYNDAKLTRAIRQRAWEQIPQLRPEAICVSCSHTHNAPTAGWLRGAGEPDPKYLQQVALAAAAALAEAFHRQEAAHLKAGAANLSGFTFNRTRPGGPVDTRVTVLCAQSAAGKPIAVVLNYQAHPVLFTDVSFHAVSRDFPGAVVDLVEQALPGAVCLYLQGACGDIEFLRGYRQQGCHDAPIRALAATALRGVVTARPVGGHGVGAAVQRAVIPVRSWTRREVSDFAEEARYRLATGDTQGWLEGIAAQMVNQPARLPERYGGSVERAVAAVSRFAINWAHETLPDLDVAPDTMQTEVQALRVGDVYLSANASELFTSLGLELQKRWTDGDLIVVGYANGTIGYLPDAFEVARGGYAAVQSPKGMRLQPFTEDSGHVMVEALVDVLDRVRN